MDTSTDSEGTAVLVPVADRDVRVHDFTILIILILLIHTALIELSTWAGVLNLVHTASPRQIMYSLNLFTYLKFLQSYCSKLGAYRLSVRILIQRQVKSLREYCTER